VNSEVWKVKPKISIQRLAPPDVYPIAGMWVRTFRIKAIHIKAGIDCRIRDFGMRTMSKARTVPSNIHSNCLRQMRNGSSKIVRAKYQDAENNSAEPIPARRKQIVSMPPMGFLISRCSALKVPNLTKNSLLYFQGAQTQNRKHASQNPKSSYNFAFSPSG